MELSKSAVMAIFWSWVLLISTAVQLPLSSAAPLRFTSHIPDGAATITRVTNQSSVTRMSQNTTHLHHFMLGNNKGEEMTLSAEDYKSIDPPPDSDTSKVKPSPIENGESSAP